MFGFNLSELLVVVVVALVVIGPKDLPKMLRKLGQYAGKLRRMAGELRAQSGIDEALRTEGLADDIAEIRKLARGELDTVQRAVDLTGLAAVPAMGAFSPPPYSEDFHVVRDREYPRDGADSYGALPDDAVVYVEGLPPSPLTRDPLYRLGDPNGVLPGVLPAAEAATSAEPAAEAATSAEPAAEAATSAEPAAEAATSAEPAAEAATSAGPAAEAATSAGPAAEAATSAGPAAEAATSADDEAEPTAEALK